MDLLNLLIYLLVAALVIYVVQLILNMLAIPSTIKSIILIIIGVVFLLLILRGAGFAQSPATVTSAQSGLWSDPATWGGTVPIANQHVTIANGHTVTYDLQNDAVL